MKYLLYKLCSIFSNKTVITVLVTRPSRAKLSAKKKIAPHPAVEIKLGEKVDAYSRLVIGRNVNAKGVHFKEWAESLFEGFTNSVRALVLTFDTHTPGKK